MNYENKYLKYKNKYLKLREELISQGINVDQIMEQELSKLSNNVKQSGGGSDDIFLPSQELTEMNLSDTPNVFDQEGGGLLEDIQSKRGNLNRVVSPAQSEIDSFRAASPPPAPPLPPVRNVSAAAPAAAAPSVRNVSAAAPAAAPPPNPQKSTTTTNVRNVYNLVDPYYSTFTVPAYNTVISTPVYTVPTNTFPILKEVMTFS